MNLALTAPLLALAGLHAPLEGLLRREDAGTALGSMLAELYRAQSQLISPGGRAFSVMRRLRACAGAQAQSAALRTEHTITFAKEVHTNLREAVEAIVA